MTSTRSNLTLVVSPQPSESEAEHRGLESAGNGVSPAAGRGGHAAPRTGNPAAEVLARLQRYERIAAVEARCHRSMRAAGGGSAAHYLHRSDRWARLHESMVRERFQLALALRMGEVSVG